MTAVTSASPKAVALVSMFVDARVQNWTLTKLIEYQDGLQIMAKGNGPKQYNH